MLNKEINPAAFFKAAGGITVLCVIAALFVYGPAALRQRAADQQLQGIGVPQFKVTGASPEIAAEKIFRMSNNEPGLFGKQMKLLRFGVLSSGYDNPVVPLQHSRHMLPSKRETTVFKVTGGALLRPVTGPGAGAEAEPVAILWYIRMTWNAKEKVWESWGVGYTTPPQK